jgi:hypothetical protein
MLNKQHQRAGVITQTFSVLMAFLLVALIVQHLQILLLQDNIQKRWVKHL